MKIRTLQVPPSDVVTSGFRRPFDLAKLCVAIGPNLGSNTPDPTWFEGWTPILAVRRTKIGATHMPTVALLRREPEGTLRIVASDHILRGDEMGADLILGPAHLDWAINAVQQAIDMFDDEAETAFHAARAILASAKGADSDEIANLLAERLKDDDLADQPALRAIEADLTALAPKIASLRSAERRAQAERLLEALVEKLEPL